MIRFAKHKDIPTILELLKQVNLVHYEGRPDLFKLGTKYDEKEIEDILSSKNKPILVFVGEDDNVKGYCFCAIKEQVETRLLQGVKTLYIDDLCVDENCRGKGVGSALYNSAVELAKELGCYNLTLNVWACNPTALAFYKKQGLMPQKTFMEKIL